MKSSIRKASSIATTLGLAAGSLALTVAVAPPAGASVQSIESTCDLSTLAGWTPTAPNSFRQAPVTWTVDGVVPATAFPSGQDVSLSGVTVTLTMPADVVGSLKAQFGPATNLGIGITQGLLGVAATNATPAAQTNTAATDMTAAPVTVTGYVPDPDDTGPLVALADPITWTFTNVPYPAFESSGATGDTMSFSPSSPGSGFVVNFVNNSFPVNSAGFGSLNNAFGGPGAGGDCRDLSAASGAIGSTTLVDSVPTVNAATYSAIAGVPTALVVTGSDPDITGIDPASWSATTPVCGAGTASVTIGSTTASSATITFNAPDAATTCTFDVSVEDTGGLASAPATMTVDVIGGDSAEQSVTQVVNGGALDVLACGDSTPDPSTCSVAMTAVDLDGDPHTSTGAINQLTVNDGRGAPAPWTLTATLSGPLENTNSALSGPNAQIPAANMTVTPGGCTPKAGNANSAPTSGVLGTLNGVVTLCSATSGSNTGGFTADAAVSLSVPSSTYAGTYVGTINFVVQ